MNADLRDRLIYERMRLEKDKKVYAERLNYLTPYRGASLIRNRRNGKKNYYYIRRKGDHRYKYLGGSGNPEVSRVRESRYLDEAIRRIDGNIALVDNILKGFLPYDSSHINEVLDDIYKCEVPLVSELYVRRSADWLEDRLGFQRNFPENYPESKRQRTPDGVWVKTLSELTIYNQLKAAGLSVIYELPLIMKDFGPPMYPDFTVLSPVDMKTEIIIEFVGRLDLKEYREKFAYRLGRYIANGYVPGVNLFFIFNDKDGSIDSLQVNKIIADICGLR